MKFSELKNWEGLTKEEKARLKWAYGNTGIAKVTKTLHDTNPESLAKATDQADKNFSSDNGAGE